MGHVQSKRKTDRKRKKISPLIEIMKSMTSDSDNVHKVADHRIYRESVNFDHISNSSGYFSSNEPSPDFSGYDIIWSHKNDGGKQWNSQNASSDANFGDESALDELCTYKGLPFNDHPVLTELQNEQNARLESMEQRMNRIRANAQQTYDRKKFAHMFRAKNEDAKTEKLLKDARDMLQKNIEMRNSGEDKNDYDYSGEIIPVKMVEDTGEIKEQEDHSYLSLTSLGAFQFSETVMLFILPFLLPLFIIVAIIRGLSKTYGWKQTTLVVKSRRNS